MRFPNYLHLAPSGVWHFRQRLPSFVARRLGRSFVKRSLATRDPKAAQLRALTLAARYAQLFEAVRVMPEKMDIRKVIEAAKQREGFTLEMGPDGFKLTTDGSDRDNEAGNKALLTALERIGQLNPMRPPQLSDSAKPAPTVPALAIGKAVALWLAEIKPSTKRKTFIIKTAAVEGFAKHYGEKKPLAEAGRVDVGNWVQALRVSGLETPTIVNKCSYLRGFFDWAKARGYYPPFAKDENPAAGQVVYRTREKRERRAFGFKPFPDADIRTLYAPEALSSLSDGARWGVLLGLYTGARVSEVGQLQLIDFATVDGVPCIHITDDGQGQSVKTEVSKRTIPIHPDLIALGLLERVEVLRKQGEVRLFPKAKATAVNGPGQWLSKAFSYYISERVAKPVKGRYGFHSLRKTVIQSLQSQGVTAEHRAAYVGHELDDEHHAAYSRKPTMPELLVQISKLGWGLRLSEIKRVLRN